MAKRILVTGGAGFIGSHLCQALLAAHNKVLCVDNLSTGQHRNIAALLPDPNFEFMHHDIVLPFDRAVDQIYNLACPASPAHYQSDPVYTLKTNVYGAVNMLDLARRTGARILQASTSEAYGDPEEHPQKESYWGNVNPIGIRSYYDEGKRCAEALFFDYYRQYAVDIRVIRIFNTYGPHMHPMDGRVVSNFIMQALQNIDITIYGDGSQTRSFQYVDDLIEAMISMMEGSSNFLGPVNIGNPEEFTIAEIAEKVLALVPESTSSIVYKDLPWDDPKRRRPDISLAKEKLQWQPVVKFDQGLSRTIRYFRELTATP